MFKEVWTSVIVICKRRCTSLGLIEYFAEVLPILCIEHLLKRCVLIYNFTMSDVVNTKKNVTFALMTKR